MRLVEEYDSPGQPISAAELLRQHPSPVADNLLPECAPKPPGVEAREWADAMRSAQTLWEKLLVGTLDVTRRSLGEAICEQLKELGKSPPVEADAQTFDRTVHQVVQLALDQPVAIDVPPTPTPVPPEPRPKPKDDRPLFP